MSRRTDDTEAFWREFIDHCGGKADGYVVVAFGDGPAMATELADLVVAGTKRATASLPIPMIFAINSSVLERAPGAQNLVNQ